MEDAALPLRWSTVEPLLREFQRHLAAHVPELKIVPANDAAWSYEEYRQRRREDRVFSGYGVYLIYDADSRLQYVGLAMNTFDDRIWGHDDHVPRRWTDAIPFDPAWYFLAPALEFFLIVNLKPPANTTYSQHTLGGRPVSED